MEIGIISDTHGKLPNEFMKVLKTCDYIIHVGDVGTEKCYKKFMEIDVPKYIIRGNCDHGIWANRLPDKLTVSIGGNIFYLIHDLNDMPYGADAECRFIISGHTHRYGCCRKNQKVYLNPGSASMDRTGIGNSMMLLHLNDGIWHSDRLLLST